MKPLVAAVSVVLLCGCSTFDRDWQAADTSAAPFFWRWQGTWLSTTNGHKGGLRCLISHLDETTYDCKFRASYQKVFRFEYSVPMTVEERNGDYHFTGKADLGKLYGGLYAYQGIISGNSFRARYDSAKDKGVFEMTRVVD